MTKCQVSGLVIFVFFFSVITKYKTATGLWPDLPAGMDIMLGRNGLCESFLFEACTAHCMLSILVTHVHIVSPLQKRYASYCNRNTSPSCTRVRLPPEVIVTIAGAK